MVAREEAREGRVEMAAVVRPAATVGLQRQTQQHTHTNTCIT